MRDPDGFLDEKGFFALPRLHPVPQLVALCAGGGSGLLAFDWLAAACRYWHRSLNPKKLIDVGFSSLAVSVLTVFDCV